MLHGRCDSCTNSEKVLSYMRSCIKENIPIIQNNGKIFKEYGNKGAVLGYIGRVTCIIEQDHKKLLSVINWTSEVEEVQETEEKQNIISQQCSVKHETVRQSMHECCSEVLSMEFSEHFLLSVRWKEHERINLKMQK